MKGGFLVIYGIIGAGLSLLAGLIAFLKAGPGFLSGTHLTIIFVVMIFAFIIYFAYVFGRAAIIKAEMNDTKHKLEISAGEDVRREK